MRRSVLGAIVGIAALWLAVISFMRDQPWIGLCFAGLGILRLVTILSARKKPAQPDVRLNLDDAPENDKAK